MVTIEMTAPATMMTNMMRSVQMTVVIPPMMLQATEKSPMKKID